MKDGSWAAKLAAAGVALALFAGCSGDKNKDVAPCPSAKVMGEPSEVTQFRDGPGRDPTDILYEARFAQVAGECKYDQGGGDIRVDLTVTIDVFKGQANTDGKAAFSYFVAIAERGEDPGSEPVVHGRESFAVTAPFPNTRKGLRYTDELKITIPRPDNRSVQSYVVYLGFELTPQQLEYNKEKLGF